MSEEAKSYVGDIGTEIETTIGVDLSSATSYIYKVKKPQGDTVSWVCSIKDTATGVVTYFTILLDFDQVGKYYYQTELQFSDGSKFLSTTQKFEVYEEYK